MNKRHFLLLYIFCLCACSRQKGGAIIDLTDIGQNEIVVPAESIYSSIKFIPLETHVQSILSSPNVFGMDGDNVLIWDQDEILRFDSNGKFLNRVGRLGKGHGEHGHINSANYDENKKIIYVGNMGGFIYKYDIEGNYIGQFKIAENGEILQTVRFNKQLDALVCETRKYSGEWLQVSLRTVSPEGGEKGTYPIYEDNEQLSQSFFWFVLYHRHVDSASPLCCHDRLSGRCNRVATGHRSLYRCRSRCVYDSYGFTGKSADFSYLYNNYPADRRPPYL